MERNAVVNSFQMPLHYPRYTKKDYQDMPEPMVDRLLSDYGLSAHGDLAYKRKFAMGAFLWTECSAADKKPRNRRDPAAAEHEFPTYQSVN